MRSSWFALVVALAVAGACSTSPPAARGGPDAPVDPRDRAGAAHRVRAPAGSIVFEDVSLIPMDREGVLEHQSVVVDHGRIAAVAPAALVDVPGSAKRIDGRGRFLVPGLADMHAHALDDDDLFLYIAAGVTQVRAPFALPNVMAQRDRVAGGELVGPSIHVEGQIVDGVPQVWPWSMGVASEADIDKVIAFHLDNHLPAIKVYERLSRELYDSLVAKARKNGLRIIGHVPEAVGLVHALESGQSSIEHLDGYNIYLTDKDSYTARRRFWQSTPLDWAGFVASFGHIDEKRLAEAAVMTQKAGTWNCPTLVLYDHYMRSDNPAVRRSFRGAGYLPPYKKAHWDPAGFPIVRTPSSYEFDEMGRARPKLLALVRALDAAGAGLLVGTDSANAGIVPGYSVQDELVLFVEAGLTPWRALRAATSGAADFLGQSKEWGRVAVGRRADLLLLRGNPLDDIKNIALREGVMVRGRWFPAAELESELANMEAYASGKRSRLAETPPVPVEGTRELLARYTIQRGGEYAGEQRVVIDRRGDGLRVVTAEVLLNGPPERVRVEVQDGLAALVRHESPRGVLELRRERAVLRATFTPPGGAAVAARFDVPRGAVFNLPTLAADHLVYAEAMKLRPGGQTTAPLVQVVVGSNKLSLERSIVRLLRRPDRKDAPGLRLFSISITARNQTLKGDLTLDRDGHLAEETLLGETTRRAD